MACAWWAFLVHKHNQLDILVCSSSPSVLKVDVGYLLEHLVHDCHNCHHWNCLCSFRWMLIVWALDKRIAQEWVGCSVLFGWCKGEGVTSQVIHIIQKSNNMFIDMSQVVHIIQKLNIMSCFHSLHVDILESIYLGLWRLCLLPVYGTTYLDTSSISLIRTIWMWIIKEKLDVAVCPPSP
jgi:hypothetical protein